MSSNFSGSSEFCYQESIKMMVRIRTAEMFIRDAFWDEKIFSFLHLSIGQEACAVGVASALSKHDIMLGNHRSHGHYLAKGGDLPKMIYEVFGDRRGCCKGYGGSMHMLDRSVGFNGSTPILVVCHHLLLVSHSRVNSLGLITSRLYFWEMAQRRRVRSWNRSILPRTSNVKLSSL